MRNWAWGDFLPDAEIPRVATGFYQCLDSGENWNDIYPILDAHGKYRQCLVQAAPIHDKSGKTSFWIGSMTDITDLSGIRRVGKLFRK